MKLTKAMREELLAGIITETFAEREAALRASEAELGNRLHERMFRGAFQMAKLAPDGLFGERAGFYLSLDAERHEITFYGPNSDGVLERESRRVPYEVHAASWSAASTMRFQSGETSAIAQAVKAFIEARLALGKDRKELETRVEAALGAFTTLENLERAWPDLKPKIDAIRAANGAAQLPAVVIPDLVAALEEARKAA